MLSLGLFSTRRAKGDLSFCGGVVLLAPQRNRCQKDSLSLIRFLKSTVAYQTLKPFPKRKELLRCHLHHVMSVKQQTFRLYKLRIEAMRQKNMEKCNLLQCHHVLASVSIPNTETILISFGCNENSQFGLINSRICQFSILPGKVADRILCMTTSNGDIFFASTLSASLFAFRLNKNFQSWQTLWEITIQDVILDMVARAVQFTRHCRMDHWRSFKIPEIRLIAQIF
ncbi:F-box protein [Trichinella spiralis]|uniref:F-box protein n=1 Tax=Trichinella spiralis TaxID=6334 RepID=A0ABR3KYB9_TRISP